MKILTTIAIVYVVFISVWVFTEALGFKDKPYLNRPLWVAAMDGVLQLTLAFMFLSLGVCVTFVALIILNFLLGLV